MDKMSFITPISCNRIKNLSITKYLILHIDQNNKLKRAIPDFNEEYISSDDSLIDDAINADKIGLFKLVSKSELSRTSSPIFSIYINEDGTISRYSEDIVKLENLLLDTKTRQTAAKLLKKKK